VRSRLDWNDVLEQRAVEQARMKELNLIVPVAPGPPKGETLAPDPAESGTPAPVPANQPAAAEEVAA
jgi:hypothetical protein